MKNRPEEAVRVLDSLEILLTACKAMGFSDAAAIEKEMSTEWQRVQTVLNEASDDLTPDGKSREVKKLQALDQRDAATPMRVATRLVGSPRWENWVRRNPIII